MKSFHKSIFCEPTRLSASVLTIGSVIRRLKIVPSSIFCFGRLKERGSIKINVSYLSNVCILLPSQKWLMPFQLLEYPWREGRLNKRAPPLLYDFKY